MMKKHNEYGFGHIIAIVLIVTIVAVGLIGWRVTQKDKKSVTQTNISTASATEKSSASTAESDISLQNLGVNLSDVLITKDATREFTSQGLKGFYVFGDKLSGNRLNPNFEFSSLKSGTKLISAIDGIVGFIKEQPETSDWEVFIQPKANSKWTIGYDHVTNVAVKKDGVVKAGDVIGEPAKQGNGALRFEIQINKDEGDTTTHLCPTTLLASSVKDKLISDLTKTQNDWETTTGLELYNPAAQDPIGCLKKTLTVNEAEGK